MSRRSSPVRRDAAGEHVWGASVDDKKAVPLRLGLGLAVARAASMRPATRASVVAFRSAERHGLWRTRIKAPLSGGTAGRRTWC